MIKSRKVFIHWHAFVLSNEYHLHRLTNRCTDCTLLYCAPCFRTFRWLAQASLLSCTCFLYSLLWHTITELNVVLFLIYFWNNAYFCEPPPCMFQYNFCPVIIIFLVPIYIRAIFQALIICSHRWSKSLASWKQLRHDGWQQR